MVGAFRVGILNFLREHDAVTTAIDIKDAFLSQLDNLDNRRAFKQALDGLTTEKLVVVNGSYDFLSWKLINGPYPLDAKIIEVKITHKGLSYTPPAQVVPRQAAAPYQAIDTPLPSPVKALNSLFKGSEAVTEQRVKSKMKELGANESHLQFDRNEQEERWRRNKHVSVVANPLTDDSFDSHQADEPDDSLAQIPLVRKVTNPKNAAINKALKWALIVVSVILVVLIAIIFKGNS